MKIDVSPEIVYQTARSSGKGGQHVNKVETMAEGYFRVETSRLLSREQKLLVLQKLASKINAEGDLQVRSQVHRSQLANKQEVAKKMNELITQALKKVKKRIPTKPTARSVEKRMESKKKNAEIKTGRMKFRL
jgi:ribosome-associated protein